MEVDELQIFKLILGQAVDGNFFIFFYEDSELNFASTHV
jgi:hypothetical protein